MKRSREHTIPLGAIEFAGGLNSDDGKLILSLLERFVQTVRRERRLAMDLDTTVGHDDDTIKDDSETEELESDSESPSNPKRYRKDESWKKDTAEYNVPYVGTSYAKGDTGTVVVGQWPTGLLQAYLRKSPLATELVGDSLVPGVGHIHKSLMKSKQGRLSQAIFMAYLLALSELVTAAIPIEKLRSKVNGEAIIHAGEMSGDASTFRFLPEIVKQRVPGLFAILKEETASGKGKAGIVGGVGTLASCVLRILANLSSTSTQTARHIARSLDSSLPDGVLRLLLRPHNKRPGKENSDKTIPREEARVAALELAVALLMERDVVVASCISTAGVKDRKIRPGILYLVLKEGLSETFLDPEALQAPKNKRYLHTVASLLSRLRLDILHRSELLQLRTLADLFSRDTVKNMCDATAHAPSFHDSISFQETLQASDSYASLTSLEKAGVEARRVVFLLVADKSLSPFLQSQRVDAASYRTREQQVVRAMILLLDCHRGLEIQRFLLHCVKTTPKLFPAFFKALSFPDSRKASAFLSRLNIVSRLLREGPSPVTCMVCDSGSIMDSYETDQILLTILASGLKKHPLGKALQSSNPIVVNETLKLLVLAIKRFKALKIDLEKMASTSLSVLQRLSYAFANWLPDLQIILATLSRFQLQSPSKYNMFLVANIGAVVRVFASVLPNSVQEVKFDWIKLLPENVESFCSAPRSLQMTLLQTLRDILHIRKESPSVLANSCRTVLEVALTTSSPLVLKLAREIALSMFSQVIMTQTDDAESKLCLRYEASCWIDGVTIQTLSELCKFLQEGSQSSFRSLVAFAEAWKASSLPGRMPALPVSAILIHVMQRLSRVSKGFLLLTCQVAAKNLLYQMNPLPLASIVLHGQRQLSESNDEDTSHALSCFDSVSCYCGSLIDFDKDTPTERNDKVRPMLSACFSPGTYPRVLVEAGHGFRVPNGPQGGVSGWDVDDTETLARQLYHLLLVSDDGVARKAHLKLLNEILAAVIMQSGSHRSRTLLGRLGSCADSIEAASIGIEKLDALFLSSRAAFTTDQTIVLGVPFEPLQSIGDIVPSSSSRLSSRLPFLFLIGPFLPEHSVTSCLVGLLDLHKESPSNTFEYKAVAATTVLYLRRFLSTSAQTTTIDSFFQDALFGAWLTLSKDPKQDMWFTELVSLMESALSRLLSVDDLGLASTTAYAACIRESLPEKIIELCLQNKQKIHRFRKGSHDSDCLLASIVDSDLPLFAPILLTKFVGSSSRECLLGQALDKGWLDNAVLTIVKDKTVVEEHPLAVGIVLQSVVSRAVKCLTGLGGAKDIEAVVSILNLLHKGFKPSDDFGLLAVALVGLLSNSKSHAKLKMKDLAPSTQKQIFILTAHVCRLDSDILKKEFEKTASALLVSLCEYVTLTLSNYRGKCLESAETGSISLQGAIALILDILTEGHRFDKAFLQTNGSSFVRRLFRACLKNGLGEVDEEMQSMQPFVLALVRKIMVAAFNEDSALNVIHLAFNNPMAPQVYGMLTTHSQFRVAIGPVSVNDGKARLEIRRLLLCCLSLADNIKFDANIWRALLSGYNAGMTESDIAMRQIISLYWCYIPEGSVIGAMEQRRWGDALSNRQQNQKWEWLVDSIDSRRIQATLRRFPVEDALLLAPVSQADIPFPLSSLAESKSQTGPTKVERDRRYSPGFLLPLVLAALEYVVDSWGGVDEVLRRAGSTKHGWMDGDERSGSENKQSGVHLTQKLCEKGGLALTLASLCSHCPSIRGTAVSVLGLLSIVIDSDAARQTPSWRERPQVAMILQSVQRALVVRQAANSSLVAPERTNSVPILPGVSAIFLARASLILMNPGDIMFSAMNRSFLKIQVEHGAFQDLNRLPAFISLFCSSSDDPRQARRERMWAMELVRDGFVHEDCYRTLVACHAPELLLTSIENFRSRSLNDRDGECALLLNTLWRILNDGGHRAASHLIGRLGLLSWLRSMLAGRPALDIFPTTILRISFVRMATLAVDASTVADIIPNDELILATTGLAQLALEFCLTSLGSRDSESSNSDDYMLLVSETNAFLNALRMSKIEPIGEQAVDTASQTCQAEGLSFESARKFLSAQSCHVQRASSVLSLCELPFRFRNDASNSASSFCKEALYIAASESNDEVRATLMQTVLRRTYLVSTLFGKAPDSDNSLVKSLLAHRKVCVQHPGGRHAWFQCLSELVDSRHVTHDNETLQLARAIVSSKVATKLSMPI